MSDVVAELASRVRLSDPMPARCSACFTSADPSIRFVDFQAAFDAGSVIDPVSAAVVDSMDELHLCEACVRSAAEQLGLKPELHSRQFREIRQLELQVEHWKDYARRVEQTLHARPEINVSNRRKAA